jgi:transposase
MKVQHFQKKGIPRRTVYNVIQKYGEYNCHEDLPRSGRPPKMDTIKVKRLSKMIDNTSGIGQNTLSATFNVNQSTISRVIKNKTKINLFKKQKVPKYEKDQEK